MTQQPRYKLVIVSPDAPAREYTIEEPLVLIGRDSTRANLVLAHTWVSRAHARLFGDREPYRIEDLGSSNGTQLNDLPLAPNEPRPLKPGDVIAIGPFRLSFEQLVSAEPSVTTDRETPEAEEPPEEESEPPAVNLAMLERLGTRRASRRPAQGPAGPPPEAPITVTGTAPVEPWVGMPSQASRWLQYLPPMFAETDFIGRYLLVFEDLIGPIQQIVAHYDMFLNPNTAPERFLPWLNDWMAHLVDEHWSPETQRELLLKANLLHQARGTVDGLSTHLRIVTGCEVRIEENVDGPHTFRVTIVCGDREIDRRIVERIIDVNRPAHTSYTLQIT